jgi:hypothetical protein
MSSGAKPVLRSYDVHFTLTVHSTSDRDTDEDELLLEEALSALLDEEILAHDAGGSRCGMQFQDLPISADARFVAEIEP